MKNIISSLTATVQTFLFTAFNQKSDVTPKEFRETLKQIVKRFSKPVIRAEKDGPLFSPAKFMPARRLKKNVTQLSMLVLDYDHGVTIDEVLAMWRPLGVMVLLYTTHSHQRVTKDHPKAEDRFRVIILLKEPIPADEYPRLFQWATVVSGGKCDASCKDASRMHYLPAIAIKGAPFVFRNLVGDMLDWRAIDLRDDAPQPTAKKANKSRYADAAINSEVSRVLTAPQGDRNNALNKAAYYLGRLVGGGVLDQAEVTEVLTDAALQAGLEDGETKATITSGLAAGVKNPRKPQMNGSASAQNPTNTQGQNRAATAPNPSQSQANSNGSSNQNSNGKSNAQTAQNAAQPNSGGKRVDAYELTPGGLVYWQQTANGEVDIPLTNFGAEIVSDVTEDDGTETKRAFEIEAQQRGKPFRFLVPAEDFTMMKWPMVHLGAKAVIYPRRTDHARCAIQVLSASPIERRVYTHTGWREIEGEMFYLHGGGAIGAQSGKAVEVRLPDSLQMAILTEPPDAEALKDRVRAILDLTYLAADEVTFPAFGAVLSAVIGGADFSFWFYGRSGSGKTELAALLQSFWGKGFRGGLKPLLPLGWESTANTMEVVGHAAKDAICVIDDFKPVTPQHRMELYKKADRILRAQGNQAGRGRLMADLSQRKTKHPRGVIISTAEEMPRGESLLARLIVIEFLPSTIDFSQLTRLQHLAGQGVFASVNSSFLRWLATNYAETIGCAPKAVEQWRDYWTNRPIASHRKYATTLGHLSYAWELWLRFVQETGAMTDAEAATLRDRVLLALGIVGSKQEPHANAQNPVTRFLELLQSAFASNKAHLESINGGPPSDATNFGWRQTGPDLQSYGKRGSDLQPCGERIGWITDDEVYLLPYATVALLERNSASGEGIGVQQTTLWKHLHEAGLLIRTKREEARRTYVAQRTVNKIVMDVLRFRAETLFKYADDADNADDARG